MLNPANKKLILIIRSAGIPILFHIIRSIENVQKHGRHNLEDCKSCHSIIATAPIMLRRMVYSLIRSLFFLHSYMQ